MRHDIRIESRKVFRQLDQLVKCESSELDDATTTALFQSLLGGGFASSLPGNCARTARALTTLAMCHPVKRSMQELAVMG
jgi:hypothetical protein